MFGALDVTDGETVALVIPPNADAETVRAAIELANRQKAEAAKAESAALAHLFLDKVAIDGEPK